MRITVTQLQHGFLVSAQVGFEAGCFSVVGDEEHRVRWWDVYSVSILYPLVVSSACPNTKPL